MTQDPILSQNCTEDKHYWNGEKERSEGRPRNSSGSLSKEGPRIRAPKTRQRTIGKKAGGEMTAPTNRTQTDAHRQQRLMATVTT